MPRSNPRKRDQGVEFSGLFNPVRFAPHQRCALLEETREPSFPQDFNGISLPFEMAHNVAQPLSFRVPEGMSVMPRLAPRSACAVAACRRALRHCDSRRGAGSLAAPEAATGWRASRPRHRQVLHDLGGQLRPRWTPAWRCCARVAARPMPPSPCSWCSIWSSRNRPGSVAAPSSCTGTRPAGSSRGYDGRETAPAAATPDRFLVEGRPRKFDEAVFGGLSVGVPGTLRAAGSRAQAARPAALGAAVRAGDPARQRTAFASRRGCTCCCAGRRADSFAPAARRYFFDADRQRLAGRLPAQEPPVRGDLARHRRGRRRRLLHGRHRRCDRRRRARGAQPPGRHHGRRSRRLQRQGARAGLRRLPELSRCAAWVRPPPAALAVAQILKLMEPFDIGKGAGRRHERTGAAPDRGSREARLRRPRRSTSAIPISCRVPAGLLNAGYLDSPARADRSGSRHGTAERRHAAADGEPQLRRRRDDGSRPAPAISPSSTTTATSLAMTTTIEAGFGSRLMGGGLPAQQRAHRLLLPPRRRATAGRSPTRVAPGKRPRSSMAPTIVFDEQGKPWAALGSPGGSRIILYVVKALVALIDWQLDAQAAAALMNFGSRGGPFEIEIDHASAVWHALKVKPYGHRVSADLLTSGTHVIVIRKDGTAGGRRRPAARGRGAGRLTIRRACRARDTHHHRCRRRHRRPLAGADAGAARTSRAARRALGRAVRASGERTRRRHARALLRGRGGRAGRARSGPAVARPVARDLPGRDVPRARWW